MDYFRSFQISGAGLALEMLRMQAATLNLANANSSAPPGTPPFQPLEIAAGEIGLSDPAASAPTMQAREAAARMIHDPAHPHADVDGFVAYANVDPLSEMVSMMRATRAYEANVKAINAAKAMAQQALQIGSSK
jgi:flagellar basal-body rod protein FlgC